MVWWLTPANDDHHQPALVYPKPWTPLAFEEETLAFGKKPYDQPIVKLCE